MKEHKNYLFLDGIRGMAATFVLLRHTGDFWGGLRFQHSYLAVDLFFVLSGFVIAHAYERKLQTGVMSFRHFLKVRAIRLYPVYFLSLLLATVLALLKLQGQPEGSSVTLAAIMTSAALALAFLPSSMPGTPVIFPLNGPYWSLFYEVIVNILYGMICRFLSNMVLVILIVVFGALTAAGALYYRHLDIGFTWDAKAALIGLSRAGFGIFLGCLLFRKKDAAHAFCQRRLGFLPSPWLAAFAMMGFLMFPNVGRANGLVDVFAVLVVFPLVVLACARGNGGRFQRFLSMLGSASYPVYVLHIPVAGFATLMLQGSIKTYAPLSGIAIVALLIAGSVWIEKNLDIPVRRWLSAKLVQPRKLTPTLTNT